MQHIFTGKMGGDLHDADLVQHNPSGNIGSTYIWYRRLTTVDRDL